MDNLPKWTYCGTEANIEMFKGFVGFIYEISLSNGKSYIGRKKFFSKRKKNFGKKKIATITDKRLKTYEYVVTESDWKTYTGSNKLLNEDLKNGVKMVNRTILQVCSTEKQMTYYETGFLFVKNALISEDYYNDNILGKFFKRDTLDFKETLN